MLSSLFAYAANWGRCCRGGYMAGPLPCFCLQWVVLCRAGVTGAACCTRGCLCCVQPAALGIASCVWCCPRCPARGYLLGPVLPAVFCGADALCCRVAPGIAGCSLHGRLYPVLPFMPGELPLPLCPCTAVPCLCSCSPHGGRCAGFVKFHFVLF